MQTMPWIIARSMVPDTVKGTSTYMCLCVCMHASVHVEVDHIVKHAKHALKQEVHMKTERKISKGDLIPSAHKLKWFPAMIDNRENTISTDFVAYLKIHHWIQI